MTTITVAYMFYSGISIEPNKRGPTGVVGSCLDMFRSVRTMGVRAIQAFTRSDITHVVVGVDDGSGMVYCNWSSKRGTQWTSRSPRITPVRVVLETGTVEDIYEMDIVLPYGEKSTWYMVLLWYLTGFPRNTISCSMVVHRVRRVMGLTTKERSPGGIYRELRRKAVDQSSASR